MDDIQDVNTLNQRKFYNRIRNSKLGT